MKQVSLLILLALIFIKCEDRTIDPFEETDAYYSMYGAFNPQNDINYLRVRDYRTFFLSDTSALFPPHVTMTNINTGETLTLPDTVVNFFGNYTYNYIINGPLEPGASYHITASNEEGNTTETEVKIPLVTMAGNGLNMDDQPFVSKVVNCDIPMKFVFDNVTSTEHIRMEAGFRYKGEVHWERITSVDKPRPVEGMNRHIAELSVFHLLVDVFPEPAELRVGVEPIYWQPVVFCPDLDTNIVHIRYTHFSEDWYKLRGTGFLGEQLLESGEVEQGLGFVGAYREGDFQFEVEFTD